jgi:hypothetical protein
MDTSHEPVHLDKLSVVQSKVMYISTAFVCVIILFDKSFEYGDGSKFWDWDGIMLKHSL